MANISEKSKISIGLLILLIPVIVWAVNKGNQTDNNTNRLDKMEPDVRQVRDAMIRQEVREKVYDPKNWEIKE